MLALQRSQLMALLRNMRADAELRINAYLAIMKCPDAETIAAISNVLQVNGDRTKFVFPNIKFHYLVSD